VAKDTKQTRPGIERLEELIHVVRDQRVMLDADLARVYGVETKQLNQAIRRNADRFPVDFAFQLTEKEFEYLKSQIAISNEGEPIMSATGTNRSQVVTGSREIKSGPDRSQFATGSQKHRDPRYLPWAFTEHGALMAANVLRSDRAVEMSVFIVRAFVKQRELAQVSQAILKRLAEIDSTLLVHDKALRDIYNKLLPLLQPTPLAPKRRIGFRQEEE